MKKRKEDRKKRKKAKQNKTKEVGVGRQHFLGEVCFLRRVKIDPSRDAASHVPHASCVNGPRLHLSPCWSPPSASAQ